MDRIRKLPLPALLALLFVLFGAFWFGIGFVVDAHGFDPVERAVGSLVYAAVATVGLGALVVLRQRRGGGDDVVRGIHRAVRTGELPSQVDRATWLRALESARWRYRNNRVVVPVSAAVSIALGVWAVVALGPTGWVFLAVCLALTAYAAWETRRALRNIERLLEQLRGRTTQPVGPPA
ncbi:hypothetical protein [Curtobacterium sp. GD1]|uniref:hypothetical protein n=1 Tax=Curtobacterium sp. GD1 TaxID=2810612 RepID=UPI001E2F0565|nr:hypothetical protein [Curtobacterium sp. GD1]MCC8909134.1 hypothetical protein [Curtobacterium sp. GD1]